VVRADVWDDIGGIDERFVGWGGEDIAFGVALRCLYGPPLEVRGALTHFWHPHAAGRSRQMPVTETSAKLMAAYQHAAFQPERMREVLSRSNASS
jgi:hypothetical protein